jgi:protein involved in polysaccharide export with SLBB domain
MQSPDVCFSGERLCVVLCCAAVWGCQPDHRVSLRQFLEMQQCAVPPPEEEPAAPAVEIDQQLGPYRVGPGDVLLITLTSTQANIIPPLQVRVDRDGNIDMPIIGSVSVGDLELEDVEDRLRQAFVPRVYSEAVAHVSLVGANTTNVLVVGAVTAPGLVQLRRTERNMLYAIVAAGGVTEDASGHAVLRRIRRPHETATFSLRDPVELKEALALEPLESGDIITVEAAVPNTVFVGGLVNRSSPQIYPPGAKITALQAIAGASGLRTDLTPTDGTLIRRMPDGRDVHVKLDLNRIARGEDPNVTLAAGDILWVPDTWETRVKDFVNRNIFFRAGVSVNYNVTGVEFMNRRELQGQGAGNQNLQDQFDPLGFLNRNTALNTLTSRPPP